MTGRHGYGAKGSKLSTRINSAEGANCKGGGKDWEEGIQCMLYVKSVEKTGNQPRYLSMGG